MLESIIVYSLLAFIMIVGGQSVVKTSENINVEHVLGYIIPIFAFTFVFGCRYDVGIDYLHYLNAYLYGTERESEPVFRFITDFMSSNGIHYAFYFALWAFIQISLVYYALKNHKYLLPYIAFFFIFGTYFMSMMNVMRQQLAACVFMVTILFIEDKKLIKYLLCILIASIFHRSALLLIIVYPILVFKDDWFQNIYLQLIIYFAAIIISISFEDRFIAALEGPFMLFTNITGYDDTYRYAILEIESLNSRTQFGNNTGLGIYINMFLTLPVLIMSKKLKCFYNSTYFNIIYTLWFVSIIAGHLFGNSIILFRPFVYLVNFKFVMLSFFAYYCVKSKGYINTMLFLGFVFIHFAIFLNIISNGEVNKSRFLFFWDKF